MRILLIRPKPHRETIGLQDVMICEPLELMTMKAVLCANGHDVSVLDMILEKKPLAFHIERYRPELVGITGYISHVNVIKEYAGIIKRIDREIAVYCGGVHAELCPEDFVCDSIDGVCKSAGEFFEKAGCPDRSYRHPDRNLPARYRKRYYYMFHRDCALLKTSFGCPYQCTFCYCKEIAPYSARPVEQVIDELKTIAQEEVYIVDDDFLFNAARLNAFCDALEAEGMQKRYLVYGRADFIANNGPVIKRLKKDGLRAVIVGIEAATQRELDGYNKKTTQSDNRAAVELLKRHDIEVYATVILGQNWDKSDFRRLRAYLKELGLVFVNLQPFTPMPRTECFDEYRDKLIIPYREHEKWDMAHLVIRPGRLSVRAYYVQIVKLYFSVSLSLKSGAYMVRRYGLADCLKLSRGAAKIACQYLIKIIRGES